MSELVTKADIDALEQGIDQLLGKIQSLLELKAYAEDLPIIGEQLSQAQAALQTITELRETIRDAIDTVSNLPDLASMAAETIRAELQSEINEALSTLAGLGQGYAGLVNVTLNSTTGDLALVLDTGRTTTMTFAPGDLGMSGLGLNMQGSASAQLAYNLDLTVGLDSQGFYLDTAGSDLSLGVDVNLGSLAANTTLGFLNFSASNISDSDPAAGADTLTLDLDSSWNQSGLVRDFSADLLNFTASGNLDLDIHLAANMGSAALPQIGADLHVDWSFNQNLLNGTSANSWNAATVTFDNVEYDFGSFVEDYVTPLLEQLDPILGPINEALAILRTPLDGMLLPEWIDMLDVVEDGQVTALDFLQLASNAGNLGIDFGPMAELIDLVDTIVDVVEFFRGRDFADAGYDVGDYTFQLQQIQGAANTLANLDINSGTFTGANVDLTGFMGTLAGLAGFNANYGEESGGEVVQRLVKNPLLSFAPVENPLSIIQLLLGQDVDLFNLDLPTVNVGIGMDADGNVTTPVTALPLPIWPAPLVTANLNVAFQAVIDLAFGYDTSGLTQYAAGGFSDPSLILNGFYLDDQREGTVDVPEVALRAAIEFVLDANFAIISAGGGGNLIGEVLLDFADSLFGEDARLYLNEIPGDILTNPFQVFDVSGRVTAGLRFYVNSVVGNLYNWNSDRITLAEFSFVQGAEDTGPPAGLADQFGGALWINIGARAGERDISNKYDGSEYFEIGAGPNGKVVVQAFGAVQVFGEDEPVTSIELDAGAGNDEVVMDPSLMVAARMTGGAGFDTLTGGGAADRLYGGTEDDWLRGKGGDDELYGESGNDYLEGGAGADRIDGGEGAYDIATYVGSQAGVTINLTAGVHIGDAAGDTFHGIEIFEGSRHNDAMTGSAGADVFASIEGDDTLSGMGGDDILAGGTGTNVLDGGDGYDIANYYFASGGITVTFDGLGGSVTGPTITDTLSNIEQVDGSSFADSMTGGAGRQIFVGAAGNDTLDGGADSDILVGGEGADTLIGGAGSDYASYVLAQAGVNATLATGGTGGEAAGDTYTGIENLIGSGFGDTLSGDGEANYIFGGGGNDTLNGAGGEDLLQGGDGDDTLNGGDADDILEGGAGADSFNGGSGLDEVTYVNSTSGVYVDRRTPADNSGDAAGDTFNGIEIITGSSHNDVIRGSDARQSLSTSTIVASGGDIGVRNNWSAANPAQFTLDTSGIGAVSEVVLTINATDIEPAVSEWNGVRELDEVLLNGVSIGFLDSATTRSDGPSTTTFTIDASLLRADGQNVVTVRNVNPTHVGEWYFTINSASLAFSAGAVETINGGAGNDFLYGGLGNDIVSGDAGDDYVFGEEGEDTLYGGDGNDQIFGGSEVDTLNGGAGNDGLYGGGDHDVLHGGTGNDHLDGGTGTLDRATWHSASSGVRVNLGLDAITIGAVTLAGLQAQDGDGGTDTIAPDAFDGYGSIEEATGSAHADILVAHDLGSRLYGGDGADILQGRSGIDWLEGGSGNDELFGGGEGDILIGNAGNDLLDGQAGSYDTASWHTDGAGVTVSLLAGTATDGYSNTDTLVSIENVWGSEFGDTITGDAGSNELYGRGGNDVLDGGEGKDVLVGGLGDDIFYVDRVMLTLASQNDLVVENSGEGSDLVRSSVEFERDLYDNVEDLQLLGTVKSGYGNSEANKLMGNAAANVLDGRGGADTFWGYAGNDIYYFDSLGDMVGTASGLRALTTGAGEVSGGGTDEIRLATANLTAVNTAYTYSIDVAWAQQVENVVLLDDARAISLTGNARDNLLVGNAHWQTLAGGTGNDVLDPKTGRDVVHGGTGTDTLRLDWSFVTTYDIATSELTVDAAGGYSGLLRNFYDYSGYNRVDFTRIEHFHISLGQLADALHTGDGNDVVHGNGGDDYLNTRGGIDQVDGGAGSADRWQADKSAATAGMTIDLTAASSVYAVGDGQGSVTGIEALGGSNADGDRFRTGSGNDTVVTFTTFLNDYIETGAGNDRAKVWSGKDVVLMGAGDDTLVIDWSDITTYDIAVSELSGTLADGYSGVLRNFYDYSGYTRVSFSGVEHFDVKLGTLADLLRTGDGNDKVFGNGGDDHLITGRGTDIVDGGVGDADRWEADKSHDGLGNVVSEALDLDLNRTGAGEFQLSYFGTGTVQGTEALTLKTGSGDDSIVTLSSFHRDILETNDGSDTVTIAGGKDTVHMGGQGAAGDTLVIDWSAVTTYNFTVTSVELQADGYAGELRNFYNYTDNSSVNFTGVEHFHVSLSQSDDVLTTGDGNDIVSGNGGGDFMRTAKGVDVVDGGTGADRWQADKSEATADITIDLNASLSTYEVAGGTGSVKNVEALGGSDADGDRFRTGSGNDTLVTHVSFERDFIETNAGDDSVKLWAGKDVAHLGAGDDTLILDWSGVDYDVTVSQLEGSLLGSYSGVLRNFYDYGNLNNVVFSGVEHFDIALGSGGDFVQTGDGDDRLSGGAGNDHLLSRRGADTVDGGEGTGDRWEADKAYHADGSVVTEAFDLDLTRTNSPQLAYFGSATVSGIEALTLATGAGDDTIVTLGLFHRDIIDAGAGSDTVEIAGGKDKIDMGGQGEAGDTLVIDWSSIDHQIATSHLDAPTADGYSGTFRNFYDYANLNRVDFTGIEHFDVTLGSGDDFVVFGDGDDIGRGGAGHDTFYTGKGVDSIYGGDQLNGTTGVDRWWADKSEATEGMVIDLTAASSSYSLDGRTGTVTGVEVLGAGSAVGSGFMTGSGDDVITTRGEFYHDYLETNGGDDVVEVAGGRDVVRMGAGTDTLVIDWSAISQHIDISSLSVDLENGGYSGVLRNYYDYADINRVDFTGVEVFDVKLGSGNDVLYTGDAADKVHGGAGGDHLLTGKGADQVDGGDGIDRWNGDKSDAADAILIDLTQTTSTYLGTGSVTEIEAMDLKTGSGNDVLVTLSAFYNETLETGAGDDRVLVAGGRDVVRMDEGDDTLVIDWSSITTNLDTASLTAEAEGGYTGTIRNYYDYSDTVRVDFAGVEHFDIRFGAGGDYFVAGDGSDRLSGGAGGDTLNGSAGDDVIDGGTGNDSLDGGEGSDTVSYASATAGVMVSLALQGAAQNTGSQGTDTLNGFENLIGSAYDDILAGSAGDNVIDGGDGVDLVSLAASAAGVTVDLSVKSGAAIVLGGDMLINVEGVVGSAFDDVLKGNSGANFIEGGLGNDDISGAGGVDTASYVSAGAGVTVDLAKVGWQDTVAAGMDRLAGIENLTGSAFADTLLGNSGANVLDGGAGGDYMNGGASNDTYMVEDAGDRVIETSASGGFDTVYSAINFALKANVETLVLTGTANLNGYGSGEANWLYGNAGNNLLNGGAGADLMKGGDGDDTYVVDDAGDRALEDSASGGYDTVMSSVNFALKAHLEALVLTGTFDISAYGNADANSLFGNTGANLLNGGAGADLMKGGAGDDTYIVDDAGDRAVEDSASGGYDIVKSAVSFGLEANVEVLALTGTGDINGYGSNQANRLFGNDGANVLNGNGGADIMRGNGGNDTYIVDDAADRVYENAGGGTDLVKSSVSFGLKSYVDVLALTGTANINAYGNNQANTLYGNTGDNILNGHTGADTMTGGAGNDTYFVDNALDQAIELAGEGIDTVKNTVSYTLGDHIEVLALQGTAAIDGTGNGQDNRLFGTSGANVLKGMGGADKLSGGNGNDTLHGGLGNDELTGGSGLDSFVFDSALGTGNVNQLLDFAAADDTIRLDRAVFGAIGTGTLAAGAFVAGTTALDADDRIIYDAASGNLFYDADGSGAADAVLFATLTPGTALTSADFVAF